jgi:C1A family cysteine protease
MKKNLLLLASLALILTCVPSFASENRFIAAPLAAEFMEYQREISSPSAQRGGGTGDTYGPGGYIPSPIDLSHIRNAEYPSLKRGAADLPRRFDLRGNGGVTPAGDQAGYNICWAYTSIGSLESTYLRSTGTTLDLSELHIASAAFNDSQPFDGAIRDGGYDNHSVAVLARWAGPVLQSAMPAGGMPSEPASTYHDRLHLENAYFMAFQFAEEFDRSTDDVRKSLIYERGGISVGLKVDVASENSPSYNRETSAGYFNGQDTRANHAVLLVGWDDDFPRTNFRAEKMPKNDGAWLAKNSWGREFGDNGFFWISYEDRGVGDGTVYLAGESDNYDVNYGYDHLGWCNSIGNEIESDTAWMANIFKSSSYRETLEAVSFYTTSNGAKYEIYVYTDLTDSLDPRSGRQAARIQAGTEDFAGYHTVKLGETVNLPANTTFSVVVKMTTPGFRFPLPVETKVQGYSSKAVIERGVSFCSFDGTSWEDMSLDDDESNVCLRAFTSSTGPSVPGGSVTPSPDDPSFGGSSGGSGSGGCASGVGGGLFAGIAALAAFGTLIARQRGSLFR